MRRVLLIASLVSVFCLGARLPAAPPAPVSAQDDLDTQVTLPRPARRVVTLAPSSTECLFAIQAGDLVVGVDEYSDFPSAARRLTHVGTFSNPDVERIFALRPELVVVTFGNPKALIKRLRRRRVAVYVQNPHTVEGVFKNMLDLGTLTGRRAEAEARVKRQQTRLKQIQRRVAKLPPVTVAVLVSDQSPLRVAGGQSHIQDVLRLAGGKNIAADLQQPYPTLDPARFVALRPEAILLAGASAKRLQRLGKRPGIRVTPAARQKRIYSVTADWLYRPGPRLVKAVEEIARLLHPKAF